MTKTQRRIHDKATAQLPLVTRYSQKSEYPKGGTAPLTAEEMAAYQWDPERYIIEVLGWTPWRGTVAAPGQCEVIDAYLLALQQLHERVEWEHGQIADADLKYWQPGEVIQNRLRIEAGHTVGKTKLASGLFSHFFDCFLPSIVYTFAPGWEQIKRLLWKEIETDRIGKGLPGRVLENCEIKRTPEHFALGRATDNSGGKGTERIQGQHGKYLMFILDEAEGVADFVYDAVDSMASGGICIVLLLANPKTRASRFYKIRIRPDVKSFRISCLHHPNCIQGREIVPGAVQRHYPVSMMTEHVEAVREHSEDDHTFELPWAPGVIYKPDAEYCFRVLGIAPANVADNTLITVGRYESACKRAKRDAEEKWDAEEPIAYLGCDVAGFGKDYGTLYIRFRGVIWRARQLFKQDYDEYSRAIRQEVLSLKALGCKKVSLRIDAGGGFGMGVLSHLKLDPQIKAAFPGTAWVVHEVHFGGTPKDEKAYDDLGTEMYAQTAETLKGAAILNPVPHLEEDLCERVYLWVNRGGVEVKKLEKKEVFKKAHGGRSPDDGDGFVLCACPDFIFKAANTSKTTPVRPQVYGLSRR